MSSPQLPQLAWQQQSDWLNVQTFGAKGNGVADDSSPIQKALLRLSEGSRANKPRRCAVIYFPPGVYRLTRTMTLGPGSGVWMVGHGRGTVLEWDGEPNGIMWLSNSTVCSRHEGITWDARGTAAVCVEHSSQTDYETQLRYQNCAFTNAREHGLLVGRGLEKQPSAEFWFVNCIFSACTAGISLLNYNDYDNIFDGCAFLNCGIGINSVNGHFATRVCYFAGSTVVDVRQLAPSHASSLRLCTSKGSHRLSKQVSGRIVR